MGENAVLMGFLGYLSQLSGRHWRWLALRLLLAGMLCGLAGWVVRDAMLRRQIDQLAEQARHHGDFYRQTLESLLSRNAALPRIIAREDRLKALLKAPRDEQRLRAANRYLLEVRDAANINTAFLLDERGLTLAASNFGQPGSYVGNNYAFRPYFIEAMNNGLGVFYGIGATTGEPGYFLAAPIEDEGRRIGAVVVKISLDDFESAMTRSGDALLLVDANGVVFLTSIADWKFRALKAISADALAQIRSSRQYHERPIQPLGLGLTLEEAPYTLRLALPETKAQNYLIRSAPVGSLGWSIVLLARTGAERQNALLAGIATALATAFALSVMIYFQLGMRRYNERRQADAKLRQAIAEKTADLRATNASLENRVEALKSTERILRETRDSAVQAGKLAVLGQMAAGISHEVNQPLTALHTFTDNAVDLLDRKQYDDVRETLGFIKQMISRMGRISGEIKNFARKSPVERRAVRLGDVVVQAAMLVESRRRQIDATITLPPPDDGALALGDPQRLEQVLVNLLLNSLDAIAASPDRRIDVLIRRDDGHIVLAVRDHGPGISAPVLPHLFEPFFTTKSSGQGLGLGLAISRMIVEEFGGQIVAINHETGGAEFRVILEAA